MKLETRSQVWGVVVAVDAMASLVVAIAVMSLYPTELWFKELVLSLTLTNCIATPVTYFMARQIQRNQELSKELQRLVDRDRLTDVATRDYFFGRMMASPDAYGTSLMIDIDHFKSVNDTFGHFAGDEVIRSVAQILQENIRKEDIVARFGGEEFVVFLYDHGPEAGYEAAERIRAEIERQAITFEGFDIAVTVSIGGSLKEACDSVETAIQEADEALYRAKEGGRNLTVFGKVSSGDQRLAS